MTEREPYPSEKQDRFIVRLPDGMRDRIKVAAEAHNRSMNAEIVSTLEDKYPAPEPDELHRKLADFFQRLTPDERTRLGIGMLMKSGYTDQEVVDAFTRGDSLKVKITVDAAEQGSSASTRSWQIEREDDSDQD